MARIIQTLILGALCAAGGVVYAQVPADASHVRPGIWAPQPQEIVAMLSSKLSLSESQTTAIAPLIAERQQMIRSIVADPAVGRLERRRKIKEIFGDTDGRINAVLTPDQRTLYAQIEQSIREQMRQYMRR